MLDCEGKVSWISKFKVLSSEQKAVPDFQKTNITKSILSPIKTYLHQTKSPILNWWKYSVNFNIYSPLEYNGQGNTCNTSVESLAKENICRKGKKLTHNALIARHMCQLYIVKKLSNADKSAFVKLLAKLLIWKNWNFEIIEKSISENASNLVR